MRKNFPIILIFIPFLFFSGMSSNGKQDKKSISHQEIEEQIKAEDSSFLHGISDLDNIYQSNLIKVKLISDQLHEIEKTNETQRNNQKK